MHVDVPGEASGLSGANPTIQKSGNDHAPNVQFISCAMINLITRGILLYQLNVLQKDLKKLIRCRRQPKDFFSHHPFFIGALSRALSAPSQRRGCAYLDSQSRS